MNNQEVHKYVHLLRMKALIISVLGNYSPAAADSSAGVWSKVS